MLDTQWPNPLYAYPRKPVLITSPHPPSLGSPGPGEIGGLLLWYYVNPTLRSLLGLSTLFKPAENSPKTVL
jgi:hypothetical protein